jgi:small subunit ribosomal protein S29
MPVLACSVQVNRPSTSLTASDVGAYYPLNTALIPEAFQPFHQAFYAPRSGGKRRNGGCLGLQKEVALTGSAAVMYRGWCHALRGELQGEEGQGRMMLLQGPSGAGKSMVLVSLVEWARADGW